jgi:formate dehydrogenase subunit delta
MENRDLIRMANQIAAFFEAYPRSEALDGIAKHIRNFWDPRMRKQLDAYIANGGEELSPLVVTALGPKKVPSEARGKTR